MHGATVRGRARLDPKAAEVGATALSDVVQVREHRAHSLATARAEGAPGVGVRVDPVVMLDVALAVGVPRYLHGGISGSDRARDSGRGRRRCGG